MGESKRKGGIAEAAVLKVAIERGYLVAIPFGEDAPYDLIVDRGGYATDLLAGGHAFGRRTYWPPS